MHICFFVEGYPYKGDPFMPFTRELIAEISKLGVKCSVVVPQSVTRAIAHKLPIRPKHWVDRFNEKAYADIYQPYAISLSSRFENIAKRISRKAPSKAYKNVKQPVDVLYGHFWRMGIIATKTDSSLPIFVASGESVINDIHSVEDKAQLQRRLHGVIYVSEDCLIESKEKGFQKDSPYIIAPNGYNPEEFYPMDRESCRKELGWPRDAFVISFLGAFSNRKGVNRLSEAITLAQKKEDIYSCFIGSGSLKPECKNILFSGSVDHENVAKYLSASDVFVLPTLHEGCCNAIVEALACGIPVISSDLRFNDELLDSSCSIRINPESVPEIAQAILKIKRDNMLRRDLSAGALVKAQTLRISSRAKCILSFIDEHIH